MMIEHISAETFHARRGAMKNAFSYGVDFVLLDPMAAQAPKLLSRNRFNLWSVHDHKHGGPRGDGSGLNWFQDELIARGFDASGAQLLLLTQPSFLGLHFNPVSFWLAVKDGKLCAFIAEVNNTFGHRHCYFCAHPDFRPIQAVEQMVATKMMHVSPFQKVAGEYRFNFAFSKDAINIRISYENGMGGVLATLRGARAPATNRSLLRAAIRRPFGAGRVVALIYWQALKLWLKRAPFLKTPTPPAPLMTDSRTFQKDVE